MTTKTITGGDLEIIYAALLKLAKLEGCTVYETLIDVSSRDTAARIDDEVFV